MVQCSEHTAYTHTDILDSTIPHTSYITTKKKLCALHRDEALKRLLKYLQYKAMTRKFMYCRNDKVCHALTHCSTWKVLRAFFFSLYFAYSYITYNIGNMGSMSTHFHMPSQYLYSAHTFVYSKVANEIRELEKQKKIRAQKQIVLSRQTKKTSFSAIDRQIKNDNLSEYKDILSQ